jgi:integrase
MSIDTTLSKSTDTFDLTHQGKTYRIFKRSGFPNWYIRVQHHKLNPSGAPKSLGSTIKVIAQANARTYLAKMAGGKWEEVQALALKSPFPTIGDVVDRYEERAKIKSAARAVNQFLNVIAEGLGYNLPPGKERAAKVRMERATVISRETMLKFRDGSAGKRPASSINSMMSSAAALFEPQAMDFYDGLMLPTEGITAFRNVPRARDPRMKNGTRFSGIPADVLARMDAAAEAMKESLPGTWATYMLMRKCGLRNEEVADLRWHWFEDMPDGSARLHLIARPGDTPAYEPKGSAGWVPVSAALLQGLREAFPSKDKQGYVLGSAPTARWDITHRDINKFVRNYLPDDNKGAYQLRMQFGSEITAEYGIEIAAVMLRHADIKTTFRHYFAPLKAGSVAPR